MYIRFIFLALSCGLLTTCSEREQPTAQTSSWYKRTVEELNFSTDTTLKEYIPASQQQVLLVQQAEDAYSINYGYSFGMCEGFCSCKIQLSSKGILQTLYRWSDQETLIRYHEITSDAYNKLIASIDYKTFKSYNEDLGCGDCSDGGNEWLTIGNGWSEKTVGGTYGYEIPAVQELLDYLRSLN